ncbi:hypothetical protein B4O97_17125 [Marispirochaeta aestuarii]|uniref:Radical SAM core domain-containing protein n=1 Tax=Marispirochaeta aestuarii TaxID=1963862 RepID=A0A1Y1RTZ9_9SPIO|nr:radical SAM protein [Marispirochaeta aestuarii]ORC31235.1 hypothetical protein B4O97_17125 [Marispirochaeta aestuarii]
MLRNPWIYITEACNLRCKYCFNPNKVLSRANTITLSNFKQIIENILFYSDISEDMPLRIVLFGGEPTLYPELLKELMDYAYGRLEGKVQFHLITNGTNITAVGDCMIEYSQKSALSIQLSIDAAPENLTLRVGDDKRQIYEDSLRKTFDFLLDNSIRFSIRATLSPEQVEDLWENFRYFVSVYDESDKITSNITFSPDFLTGKWSEDNFSRLDEQVDKIVSCITNEYVEKKRILHETNTKRAFTNLYRKKNKTTPSRRTFCGFSNNLFSIAPNGDAFACHRVYENTRLQFGNFLDGTIDIAKFNGIYAAYNNAQFIRPNKRIGIEKCSDCEIQWNCASVCPAENAHSTSSAEIEYECDYVMYRMQKSFAVHVEKYMTSLLEDEEYKKRMVN